MDRQIIEGMLGDALEREIITAKMVDGAYPPAVAVGILDGPGREIGFGHGESQLTVILPDIGDCARFVDSCKALGGKVPLGTYGGELVYYTDEGAGPVLFQQADGDWRLASDNFLAENAIVEDLERAYTGEISPVYLNRDIVDMEEMAEAYGWVRPERTPASIAAVARKAAASSAAEKPSPGKVADAASEVPKDSAPRH